MLSSAALALANCPRMARHKATRESWAETLHAGQRGISTGCTAAGAIMTLACSAR